MGTTAVTRRRAKVSDGEHELAAWAKGLDVDPNGAREGARALLKEVRSLRKRVAELAAQAEMACLSPADDCGCAGCLTARERNGEASDE